MKGKPAQLRAIAIQTIVVALIAGSSYAIGPITLYVDAGSGCTSGCGSQSAPYPAIQAAIDDANAKIGGGLATEATIVVAPGTYAEHLLVYPSVHVECDSPSTVTINASGFSRAAVVFGSLGTGRTATDFSIDGCTITGGSGEVRSTLVGGGGVFIFGNPVISNNVIRDNVVSGPRDDYVGGGIYVSDGDPVISGNIIMRNVANPPPLGGQDNSFGLGGGIYVLGQFSGVSTHPQIVDNLFLDNFAGGQVGKGGAIRIDGNPGALVSRNTLIGNRASHSGGGIEAYNDLTISDNLIYGNSALLFGGGIDSLQSSIQITNNTIVGNGLTATAAPSGYSYANYGGGLHLRALIPQVPPEVSLTNNLLSGNTIHQSGAGAGIYTLYTYPVTTHNDSHGNLKLPGAGSHMEGDFSDFDFLTMTGNISQDPDYANAPLFNDVTVAAGTATTVKVLDASRYTVNQKIEYNDDGVLRTVTALNTSTDALTFTPPLPAFSKAFKLVADWNVASTANEDFHLPAGSPAIDAGDGGAVSALDLDRNPRISDGDINGSSIVDMGAY